MPAIQWNPEMHLGIPELDLARQTLIEIVNRLDEGVAQNAARDDLAAMLRRFSHVARDYVVLERRYLLLYEGRDPQKEKREDAVEEITLEIIDGLVNYLEGGNAIDSELLEQIKTWLAYHLGATRALKSHRADAGPNAPRPDSIQGDRKNG